MRLLIAAATTALLGAGCAQRPPGGAEAPADSARALGDSVMVPAPAEMPPDLVALGTLQSSGGARYGTVTVGEAGLLRAESATQLAAARRAVDSGMYLADPYTVLYLTPAVGSDAVATYPEAYPVGTPISVEALVRLTGSGPAPVLRFEHAVAGVVGGRDPRRVPSAVAFELLPAADGTGYDRARILLGGGADWSEQPEVALPAGDWREFAHRIGLVIARDHVGLVVDGTAVIETPVRLHGPPARPAARATAGAAGAAGAAVLVLQWTSVVEEVE